MSFYSKYFKINDHISFLYKSHEFVITRLMRAATLSRMAHTIVLVEDDTRIRERLAAGIGTQADLHLVAAVGTFAQARAALDAHAPDVLLVDLGLPDGNGADLIAPALRLHARVVILTVFNNGPRLGAALAAGAYGFLFKDSSPGTIARTLKNIFTDAPALPAAANHQFM